MSSSSSRAPRAAVVGGGLAGLAAAMYLARAGHPVRLYDKARDLGGRARTRQIAGFRFNLGPHALYAGGAARAVLDELGVRWTGSKVGGGGAIAVRDGRVHTMPVGMVSLLTTGLLGLGGKLEAARVLARLGAVDTEALAGTTLSAWLDGAVRDPTVRQLLEALARIATYSNAPDRVDAGKVVRQMQMAMRGSVYYLDGGWQSLVDDAQRLAEAEGVVIETGRRIDTLAELDADAVVIAADPTTASALVGRDLAPGPAVHAACLDIALDGLPRPRTWFAAGLDAPTYLSVHTRFANLAPEGGAVIHAAKYLAPDSDSRGAREELEALVELAQPGWRGRTVHARFLPDMIVSHAMPAAGPRAAVEQGGGVFVAGDWVGDEGLLSDAALASARRAAELASAHLSTAAEVAAA